MTEAAKEPVDELEELPPFTLDSSLEDKVDTLWRQLMAYRSMAEADLSDSKARRAQAEAALEEAEIQAIETTQAMCERMRAKWEDRLEELENLKLEATKARREAEAQLSSANETKALAEQERERVIAEANNKAQQILDQARMAAQKELLRLERQALRSKSPVTARLGRRLSDIWRSSA